MVMIAKSTYMKVQLSSIVNTKQWKLIQLHFCWHIGSAARVYRKVSVSSINPKNLDIPRPKIYPIYPCFLFNSNLVESPRPFTLFL